VFLEGERIRLGVPGKEHVELFVRWFNDPEVRRFLERHRPLGRREEEEWLENLHKRNEEVVFLIHEKEENRPIGCCGIHRISLPNRSAEVGIALGEKAFWNRGFGGEALNLLCGYAFNELNLHGIGLSVYEYNTRGVRCYEKVGFVHEGRRREALFKEGRYWDILEMGLLAREWRERNSQAKVAGNGRSLCQAE